MSIEMKMPRLSDTMEQGTVVRWAVKPGQKVKSGDVVADIETDKATMELQTYDEGTVASLVVGEGQSVPVGTVIMRLAEAGEDLATVGATQTSAAVKERVEKPAQAAAGSSRAAPPAPTRATETAESPAAPAPSSNGSHAPSADRIFASPLARKIAGESGVDLSRVEGTGPAGRIVRKDVEAAAKSGSGGPALRAGSSGGAAASPRTVNLSNMRATIAKRLVQSKATIPHYQVTVAVRMDALFSLRAQLNEQLAAQGVKLSVNDFLVRACALAMRQHPFVNARWSEPKPGAAAIDVLADVNIGIAIALPVDSEKLTGGGLVVATLRRADQIGLRQISAESRRLSEKARTKGLSIEEMADSTFTISNLGMFGVEHFTAIINPPNSAILAVGAAVEKPVIVTNSKSGEKSIAIGHEMQMTMSSDHRVIDGAMAAAYLATVKDLLEKPATLLV